ncbi:MAG: ankyrin repeat domain-containing protein [Planctomycetes bacterium]|nr:ankyrin repeat domain-containing protein [Planctomycetota bacterium]
MFYRRRKLIIVVGFILLFIAALGRIRIERRYELVPAPLILRAIDADTTAAQLAAILDENPSLISDQDESGASLIHHAARVGRPEVVKLLLRRGADPNAMGRGFSASTPLMTAVRSNRRDVVLMLLDGGADPTRSTSIGTPLKFAESEGLDEIAQILSETIERLNAEEAPTSPPSRSP